MKVDCVCGGKCPCHENKMPEGKMNEDGTKSIDLSQPGEAKEEYIEERILHRLF